MIRGFKGRLLRRLSTRPEPTINAPSALCITANGRVTYAKDPDTARVPASVIKLMVLHLARTAITDDMLHDTVTFTEADASRGTSAKLKPGDVITWNDLFHGLMLPSGNDAAKCIARNVGSLHEGEGSPLRRFIAAMNARAVEEFGWQGASFSSASGLERRSRLTARQACELALALDPYATAVSGATSHDITITGPNARSYTLEHTVSAAGPVHFPEMVAAKTGTLKGNPQLANCVMLWDDGRGRHHATAVLNSWPRDERLHDTRAIMDYTTGTTPSHPQR